MVDQHQANREGGEQAEEHDHARCGARRFPPHARAGFMTTSARRQAERQDLPRAASTREEEQRDRGRRREVAAVDAAEEGQRRVSTCVMS